MALISLKPHSKAPGPRIKTQATRSRGFSDRDRARQDVDPAATPPPGQGALCRAYPGLRHLRLRAGRSHRRLDADRPDHPRARLGARPDRGARGRGAGADEAELRLGRIRDARRLAPAHPPARRDAQRSGRSTDPVAQSARCVSGDAAAARRAHPAAPHRADRRLRDAPARRRRQFRAALRHRARARRSPAVAGPADRGGRQPDGAASPGRAQGHRHRGADDPLRGCAERTGLHA